MSQESFRVDLRGIVDILSHHLYSSPRVHLRELIQNAGDAVVARATFEPGAPQQIVVQTDGVVLEVRDHGIGLTEDEMRTVLATIGASSKRHDFTETRRQFLGQFGIGLLSCFLIADRIEVLSRSARSPDAPTLRWVGSSDGTFTIETATTALPEPGTTVRIAARPDDAEWVRPERVQLLISRFAELLGLPVVLRTTTGDEILSTRTPPWQLDPAAAAEWCAETLGFEPLAALPIAIPTAGVHGVAFIADSPGRVGNRSGDTVHSHGMFVADDNVQLVPDWAYFVRLVVEAGELALTASRESLQQSATVDEVRDQIGLQLRAGIERFAAADPDGFARFLSVHSKGLLAMAAGDTDLLDLVVRHARWETSLGPRTLAEVLRGHDTVRYTTSQTEFSAFAPVLRARGTLLVNGSYVYGREILDLVRERPGRARTIRAFDATRFVDELDAAPADPIRSRLDALARPVLDGLGLDLELRNFAPASMPVLLVPGPGGLDLTGSEQDDPWAEFIAEVPTMRSRLVLNLASPAVQPLVDLDTPGVAAEAITGLAVIGLLMSGEELGEHHAALLTSTLQALITAART